MLGTMMDYPLTLTRILEHARDIHGDKNVHALLSNGKIHTYDFTTFFNRVSNLADALLDFGIQQGDRIATFAFNTHQHLELFYAIPNVGAVLHPLNVRLTPKQVAKIVIEAEDKLFFVEGIFSEKFAALQQDIGVVNTVFFDENKERHQKREDKTLEYESFISNANEILTSDIQDEDIALALCFTSGTNGEPKGILYSHRSVFLHTLAVNQTDVFGLTESDVVLPLVPMYHALAWGLPYAAMFVGADIVLHGTDYDGVVGLIAELGVTVAAGVPTVWKTLLDDLRRNKQDISSLKRIIVGGEPMPQALIETFEEELGVEVRHAWGMTEMSPTGTFSSICKKHEHLPDFEKHQIKAMQGRPIPGVQIRLAGEDDCNLPWDGNTIGEIQVRSPWTTGTYYRSRPSLEYHTLDGWLRTGDLATINADGYMQIVDRCRGIIKSGGELISSLELESVLIQHTLVEDVAVIGMKDEKWGERPIALIVLSEYTKDISKKLIMYLSDKFPKYWIPDMFIILDEIPKTSVGKTDKKSIMEMLSENNLTT